MEFFYVLVLTCVVVLQVANADRGCKCGKYKGEMMKIFKEMHDGDQMPGCAQKYNDYLDPILNAENHEEKMKGMKKFHDWYNSANEDDIDEFYKCKKEVTDQIVEQMKNKPDKECMDEMMKRKGQKEEE